MHSPQNQYERLELANRLFREFHARCFWHSPRDLVVTEESIPFVVKGLRTHGGRRGFMLAEKLQPKKELLGVPPTRSSKMPLTPFQRGVAHILTANRTPESHLAGGAIINRGETSLRFSDDLDIFHDVAASVAASAEADATTLRAAGYSVEWTFRAEGFYRAEASRSEDRVRLDWTTDSVFRFFPVQRDEEFGYCLHRADLATNKVLALAGRSEVRDFLDILQLDQDYLGLGAIVWAACGKDPGFTPDLLLDQTNRHSRYQESDLKDEHLARPVDLRELKQQWLAARERARKLSEELPAEELGCLYLDEQNRPVTPDPNSPDFGKWTRHKGSIRGAWPKLS